MGMESLEPLIEKALSRDKRAIARLITLVENDEEKAREIIRRIYPHTGKAYVVGITGPPGSGKSTLLDKLIKLARNEGHRVGVIAIDPTSPFTGGALLGDRLRMQRHSTDPGVFIRSMATRGSLGGLAKATNDAIKILDASGYDLIFVETVGVGQVEVDIVKTADTVVLVTVPGLGDEVQAIKAGLMEVADIFAINKADREGVEMVYLELKMALEFERDKWKQLGWEPPIVETTAFTLKGVRPLWEAIKRHREYMESSGRLKERRAFRAREEVKTIIASTIAKKIEEMLARGEAGELIDEVVERKLDPYSAAQLVMETLKENLWG
ncbi:methylmalonyl Co-A mutase-associated GTPase MeaB [Thermococcus sp.]